MENNERKKLLVRRAITISHTTIVSSLVIAISSFGFALASVCTESAVSWRLYSRAGFAAAIVALAVATVGLAASRFLKHKGPNQTCPVLAIILALLYLAVARGSAARFVEHKATTRLRQLGETILHYTQANHGYLPPADNWCDSLLEYDETLSREAFTQFQRAEAKCNFAFNKNIGGQPLAEIPGDVVLLFEADGNWNLAGGADLMAQAEDYGSGVLLVDGAFFNYYSWEGGLRKWDPETNKTTFAPLRWKP